MHRGSNKFSGKWLRLWRIRGSQLPGPHTRQEVAVVSPQDRFGRWFYGLVVSLCMMTLLSTLLTGWPLVCWYHDWQMLRFSHSLGSPPLPPGSRVVATRKRFGLLWGNSNHCDAQVMALVETTQDDAGIFANFEDPVPLKQPFSDASQYLDIMKIVDSSLHWVFEGETYPDSIRLDSIEFVYPKAPLGSVWDRRDYEAAQQLADDYPLLPDKNYYVLVAEDQISSGYDMQDIRCH